MPYSIVKQTSDLNWIKICGQLTILDLLAIQVLDQESPQQSARLQTLIELENFEGWSNEPGWESTSFLPDQDHENYRIAIVGDEKWKDEVFMFIGYPMRDIDIAFFPPTQLSEAQAWFSRD